jgi:hypothetical protein
MLVILLIQMELGWQMVCLEVQVLLCLDGFREIHYLVAKGYLSLGMQYLRYLQSQYYAFDLFSQVILLEQGQFIIVNLIEADDGEFKQGNKVFDHICHPFELLLLFHIQVLRLLLSV